MGEERVGRGEGVGRGGGRGAGEGGRVEEGLFVLSYADSVVYRLTIEKSAKWCGDGTKPWRRVNAALVTPAAAGIFR